ncbi:MAG: hypothetical protein ACOX7G_04825 [Candidatus Scatomorpha sp.]|jgi:hypothetical protein
MAYPDDGVVQTWLDALKDLDVRVKKMFGCYCVYCDDEPVGWLSEDVFSLREAGLTYLPDALKRPAPVDRVQEIPPWITAAANGSPERCRIRQTRASAARHEPR